ncbi:MAG: ATP phosphoribosyltransferase regulatory subunit, partial [Anaerolineae bacterium]
MTQQREEPAPGLGRSQIPRGVQDRFLADATRRRRAELAVVRCFARWGYQEIIPPTFEFYDNLSIGARADLKRAMYRFFDPEGYTLALRADFTPQVARMAATKLFDQPMPLRCFYMGSVFRHEEPQAGRKREFTQAGAELIGADTAQADAEIVSLAVATLEALALQGFQVNLGQMAFFRALSEGLAPEALEAIREAIDRKNHARLAQALDEAEVSGRQRDLLSRLPDLSGGPEILEEARALSVNLDWDSRLVAALERLTEIYCLLDAYGVADHVILDLGEVRGMDYYTGITFRGVTPGLGWPIISGGRYDNLIARFGRPLAAVGFGLGIERALLAQSRQGVPPPELAPHLLAGGCVHEACLAMVGQLRRLGCRVEVDPSGTAAGNLAVLARQRGIARTLQCAAGGWLL